MIDNHKKPGVALVEAGDPGGLIQGTVRAQDVGNTFGPPQDMGRRSRRTSRVTTYDSYGLSEVMAPGGWPASAWPATCSTLAEDHFLVEGHRS